MTDDAQPHDQAGPPAALVQLNVIVADMARAVDFYRALGLEVPFEPGDFHVGITLPGGMRIDLDTADFARQWDARFGGTTGGSTVLFFSQPTGEAVDAAYERALAAGGTAHQPPYDAFFGARFAIVDDPDGTPIGFMGPRDLPHFWPPAEPPAPEG